MKQNVMKNIKALIPPPLPLFDKKYIMSLDEPAWTGCPYRFITLGKFKGRDLGCKIGEESSDAIEKQEFNPSSTLMDVFDFSKNEKNIVYIRSNQNT